MSSEAVAALIIAAFGAIGSAVAVWVKTNNKLALAEQQAKFINGQLDKLEIRVGSIEKNVADKIDAIHEDLNDIKISIGKLLNK